jgi:5-methylthioadenosine/S-adenosylhomocysteine deaminase
MNATRAPTAATLLIRDALIVPCDSGGAAPFFGWVAVDGTRIAGLGEGKPPSSLSAKRVVDAEGCALLPGFVNAHAHSHSSLTRGSAEGLALEEWIATIEREQARLSDDDAYVAALATYGELLLSGTTSVVDMCLRPAPAIRAAREIGIRCAIAPYVIEGRSFAPTVADVARLLEARPAGDERIAVWVGLHDLESCTDETIREGAALARRFATGLHLHCAESRHNVERTRARTGVSPIPHLDALGALGSNTLLAHCVWADADDIALLKQRDTAVTHCPHANLKLGSGIAPVGAMVRAGVRVALGTDGAKANNRLDLFDVMKFTSLLHKGISHDPGMLPPDAVLAMATRVGADTLRFDAGAIAVGKLADITLIDLRRFHLQPATPATVQTNLVHSARGSDVRTVVVSGEIVVEDGRLANIDERATLDAMRGIATRLMDEGMGPPARVSGGPAPLTR